MFGKTLDGSAQAIRGGVLKMLDHVAARHQAVRFAGFASVVCLAASAPVLAAQSYIPPIVTTAGTTLYSSTTPLSPGRVAVDKAGNVFYIATAASSTLTELPAASPGTPKTLITGLGQYNAKAVVVDANGNLWASTGNQASENSDYVDLVEIPALNGIPNTALVGSGESLAAADGNHCTLTGTAVCTVLNYKLNDAAGTINGPQALDFTIDTAGNITYVDIGDNKLPSGTAKVVSSNVYNGNGTVLASVTQDYSAQVAVDGAGIVYYVTGGKVSSISGGTLTAVGTTATITTAIVASPTGIASDFYGNLYISNSTQISEVPFEGTALKFADEFGIINGLTNAVTYGGGLDQNGNFYYATNSSTATGFQQLQINGYNFGSVAIGKTINSSSTPAAPSLSLYDNVAQSGVSSYFPTGSPTTNTTAAYLQSFPYSGTKSFSGGSNFTPGSVYTITMNFQPIHPGLLKGSFTPRSGSTDLTVVNLQGTGVGSLPTFFPGNPSLVFNSAASSKTLNQPRGLAVDTYGDIFVADTGNSKIVADCLATTVANEDGNGSGTTNTFCANSGNTGAITQLSTGFTSPVAIALDGAQSLYVLDNASTTAAVTVINGQNNASSILVAAAATFGGTALSGAQGLAVDGYTNVYIADTGNNRIVEAHQFGATATDNVVYVPSATTFSGTKLSGPTGLAVDAAQNLYIADTGNNRIVEYSSTGVASVVNTGSITLSSPYAVAAYPSGALVVSDAGNGTVLLNGNQSQVLSFGSSYTATGAKGVALDPFGNIFVSNTNANQVLELDVTSPQSITYTNTNAQSTGPLVTEIVADSGNASLVLSGITVSNNNFAVDSSSTCTSSSTVTAGNSCTVVSKFTPQTVGPQTGSITLTDNQLGYTLNNSTSNQTATFGTSGTQAFNLSGTGLSSGAPQTITFQPLASPITYTTTPIPLKATASSGLPVTFSVLSGPGQIDSTGTNLVVTGVGSIVVAADQAGSTSYSAAKEVTQTVVVNQASQTLTFDPSTPSTVNYSAKTFTVSATSTSGLAPTYSIVSGPGTISGGTVTITGLGTIVVAASQPGNANYAAAPTIQTSIVVNPIGTLSAPVFVFANTGIAAASGTYNAAYVQPLTIISTGNPAGTVIYYTTDGSTPPTSPTSKQYTTSITLTGTETVKAVAVLAGYAPSPVISATFTINTSAESLSYTLNPTSLTLQRGQSGTVNITVTPQNGINAQILFGCTGLPIGATCSFSQNPVATGPTQVPVSTVLTITAPTTLSSLQRRTSPFLPETTLAVVVCLFGWRKRRKLQVGLLLGLVALGLSMVSGCGSSAPASQASAITVSISGDAVRYTPQVTLNVH